MGFELALIELSAGCNSDCIFCLRNAVRANGEPKGRPDFGRLKSFLSLCRWIGIDRVEIAGDEPTNAGDALLGRTARFCRDFGFSLVVLNSNGLRLGSTSFLHRLIDQGFNSFSLPLYGPTPDVHDRILQRDGGHASVVRALDHLVSFHRDVVLNVHTVVMRRNEAYLREMQRLTGRWGLPLRLHGLHHGPKHVDFGPLTPEGSEGQVLARKYDERREIRYDFMDGEIDVDVEPEPARRNWRSVFDRAGIPGDAAEAILRRFDRKPAFRDPEKLLRILDLAGRRMWRAFDFELVSAGSAAEAWKLGRRKLLEGSWRDAARAFEEVRLFQAFNDEDHRARKEALVAGRRLAMQCRRHVTGAAL